MLNNSLITQLKAQRANFIEQINHIDAMLKLSGVDMSGMDNIGDDNFSSVPHPRPYAKDDSYQKKIALLLKQQGRFLSINELASLVTEYEPKVTLEDAKKSLGSAKNLLLKNKQLVKVQVGKNNSNSFYGSPNWIDEKGEPKSEFKYKESALQLKAEIEI